MKSAQDSNYEVDIKNLKFGKELDGCRCLNLCEVRLILTDQLRANCKRTPQAQTLLRQACEYSAKFAKIKLRQAVLDLRSVLEKQGDLQEFEIASLVNILPRSTEEAKCLITSLARLSDQRLNEILEELESYRIFAA